jgi:hypothetical protein
MKIKIQIKADRFQESNSTGRGKREVDHLLKWTTTTTAIWSISFVCSIISIIREIEHTVLHFIRVW